MKGSRRLLGIRPSSAKRLSQAFRLRICVSTSCREGRPIPVNFSKVRFTVSFAYMTRSSSGFAVVPRIALTRGTLLRSSRLLPLYAVAQRLHQINDVAFTLLGLGDLDLLARGFPLHQF